MTFCGLPFPTKNLMLKVPNMGNVSGKEGGSGGGEEVMTFFDDAAFVVSIYQM